MRARRVLRRSRRRQDDGDRQSEDVYFDVQSELRKLSYDLIWAQEVTPGQRRCMRGSTAMRHLVSCIGHDLPGSYFSPASPFTLLTFTFRSTLFQPSPNTNGRPSAAQPTAKYSVFTIASLYALTSPAT